MSYLIAKRVGGTLYVYTRGDLASCERVMSSLLRAAEAGMMSCELSDYEIMTDEAYTEASGRTPWGCQRQNGAAALA